MASSQTAASIGSELLEEPNFEAGKSFPRWKGTIRISESWSAYLNSSAVSASNFILVGSGGVATLRWGPEAKSARLYQRVDLAPLQKGGQRTLHLRIEGPDAAQLMPSIKALQIQRITPAGGEPICEFNNFATSGGADGGFVLTARASLPLLSPDEQHRLSIEFRISAGKAALSRVSMTATTGGSAAVAPRAAKTARAERPAAKSPALTPLADARPTLAVVTWDLGHNPAGRAFVLAELAKPHFRVDIVGPLFPRFGAQVWPPVARSADFPIVGLRSASFEELFEQALGLADVKAYDYVCICKPRLPAVLIGTILAARTNAKILVDIDEDELAFFENASELDLGAALEAAAQDPADAALPFGRSWTGLALHMIRALPFVTVSNEALQRRFDGLIVRHARDEQTFSPTAAVREAARAELGLAEADRAILFIGTPRAHKGLLQIARVLEELADPRLVLVVVGSFRDESLARLLRELSNARVILLEDQPLRRLPQLIQAADVVPALLDASRPISQTQMPAKVTDALAAGAQVIASPIPPLEGLIARGLVIGVKDDDDLKTFLRSFAEQADEASQDRAFNARRREFLGEYSYSVNASRFRLATSAANGHRFDETIAGLAKSLITVAEAQAVPSPTVKRLRDLGRRRKQGAQTDQPLRELGALGDAGPSVNWVIGPDSNIEWAYGNNAKRLSIELPGWEHHLAGTAPSDLAVYFDAIVAERYPQQSLASVLRVGGPRPLDRLYGDDVSKLERGLSKFDAVITLNAALQRRVSEVHANAWVIPNGLDLTLWSPENLIPAERPFTIGFAASAASSAERLVKGLDHVLEAAALTDTPLRRAHKGAEQVKHDAMITSFYSEIDVLVHPVAPGREGCSNVIMEALSLGIPVITTDNAGYHSEFLTDGQDVLFCVQDARSVAEKVLMLRESPDLRSRIGAAGRRFAERNHDIKLIAAQYREVMRSALADALSRRSEQTVAFLPFWKPAPKFASSRLRAEFPSAIVQKQPTNAQVVPDEATADIAVVVQSAEDPTYQRIAQDRGQFLIYDVCDRYFENAKTFRTPTGEVDSLARFHQLAERANLLIAPTTELKAELAVRFPSKPVYYVPEAIDYSRALHPVTPASKQVLWFGSPQRGNFDSAKWLLDHLRTEHDYAVQIISRKSYFSRMPVYGECAEDWSIDSFVDKLKQASICVVTHALDEETKSPNRFVTAVAHGVPTIVSQSRPCEEILKAAGCDWAIVQSPAELSEAVRRLEDPAERAQYVRAVQGAIDQRHGDGAVRRAYARLFNQLTYRSAQSRARNVAFVTHNLNFGEGAPKSLFELAIGLRELGAVNPYVYCAARGELERLYQEEGVSVSTFSSAYRPPMRTLNQRFPEVREAFQKYLRDNHIEYVLANTIKSAPYALFAKEVGVPSSIIIRESFVGDDRYEYYSDEAARAAKRGLLEADNIVFVSQNTMTLWADEPMSPSVRLIKNGVNPASFSAALARSQASAREALGLADHDVIAVCVGTINDRKGQKELARWYVELPPDIKSRLTILFVGATEGRGLNDFMELRSGLDPADQDRLLVISTTPDIGLYFRASDMFLMNSSQESYPRSTMEGLLFGLPVVSTPVFGVLEQLNDGENGFIYDFNDGVRWSERVASLVTDDRRRANMSAEAARSFWRLTTHAEMLHEYRCIINP
ncbi:glycosyltransferase [Hansschlegelia zhihuaiae]|uniref:Glycosyltransferase n=1 Tax=Hansschlegelia zhihuaiae TaxID=405005 RepID=A0A4Q0MJH4_9HYPH|nr:glycosyltransferase [Hansschlegelia zhihuaiae]RXF73249.1 glycosyltransferase [Hansschlegelia zhihuaiae]